MYVLYKHLVYELEENMNICVHLCFTGMQTSKPDGKPLIDAGSTTVFPHPNKGINKNTIRQAVSVSIHHHPVFLVVSPQKHTHTSIFQIPQDRVT